jgi:hypothetical protein
MVGCSTKLLNSVSGGLSKASTDAAVIMVDSQMEKNVKSRKSSQGKIGANVSTTLTPSTLQDDPSLGKFYLKNTQTTQLLNYSGQYIDRWTGAVSQVEGCYLRITMQIESIANPLNPKKDGKDPLPQIVRFEEDVGSLGEIPWVLRRCSWFRIKTNPAKVGSLSNSLPCIIRGFDATGKCIFYREWDYFPNGLHPKKATNPTPVESAPKPRARITIPKMIKPS